MAKVLVSDDEEIYQLARKWVGAIIQSITYYEFLPAIGVAMGSYQGYDSNVQPDIFNAFARPIPFSTYFSTRAESEDKRVTFILSFRWVVSS